MSTPDVAVVIPYFQREPGLLRKGVESILAQRFDGSCLVIVVDDGSPLPAAVEMGPLRDHPNVRIVVQSNAGPGAARNAGLANVPQGTPYVAFLDSDDCWREGFVADALTALQRGCDMFFANTQRFGIDTPRFEWPHSSGRRLDPTEHDAIDASLGLYRFKGDFFDFAVVRSGIISTSTLVYRRDRFPDLRFEPSLFNGQDRYFKLQLAQTARAVGFSTRVSASEGQGVNIFDSSRWGLPKSLNLLSNYIRLQKLILNSLPLTGPQRVFVQGQLRQSRQDLARTVVHLLRTQTRFPFDLLARTFRADPMSGLLFIPNLVRTAWQKLTPAQARNTDTGPEPRR